MKVRNKSFGLLFIITLLGMALSVLPLDTAAAADGPLLTILNHKGAFDFGRRKTGTAGPADTITFANSGTMNLEISRVRLLGTNPDDFALTNDNCSGHVLTPDGTCTVTVNFLPAATGMNFFRVEGADVGGKGINLIQTNLFLIQGKIFQ